MPPQEHPGLVRRQLRNEVRELRERRALTQKQVADALDWSPSKVVRIENGIVKISITDLRALLTLYEISDKDESARLIELARVARRRPWYRKFEHALDSDFEAYLNYEGSASEICIFQTLTVPGLLQTEDYARAVLRVCDVSHQEEDPAGRLEERLEERLELRVARQAIVRREEGPFLRCLIDEAALRRRVGGSAVMRDQLIQLRAAAEEPKISIGIVPFASGEHPSMTGSFTTLRSNDWDEDVLFQEGAERTITNRENQRLVEIYSARFDWLDDVAVKGEQAIALLDMCINDLTDAAQAERVG